MKKNKKKKFQIPKRNGLTYLILIGGLIVLLLAIFIPLSYDSEYKENKVIPFAEDLNIHVGHEHEGEEHEEPIDYKDGSLADITDFNLVVKCTEYKDTVGSVSFSCYAYENDKTDSLNVKNVSIKLAMCSNWIGLDEESTSRSLTMYATEEKGKSGARTLTINNLPDLPAKGNLPFINIKTVNLYILLTYDSTVNGKTTKNYYVLTVPYSEYIVGAIGGIEK